MDEAIEVYTRSTNWLQAPRRGQGLVEYALIIALVATLIVGSLVALRTGLEGAFQTVITAL